MRENTSTIQSSFTQSIADLIRKKFLRMIMGWRDKTSSCRKIYVRIVLSVLETHSAGMENVSRTIQSLEAHVGQHLSVTGTSIVPVPCVNLPFHTGQSASMMNHVALDMAVSTPRLDQDATNTCSLRSATNCRASRTNGSVNLDMQLTGRKMEKEESSACHRPKVLETLNWALRRTKSAITNISLMLRSQASLKSATASPSVGLTPTISITAECRKETILFQTFWMCWVMPLVQICNVTVIIKWATNSKALRIAETFKTPIRKCPLMLWDRPDFISMEILILWWSTIQNVWKVQLPSISGTLKTRRELSTDQWYLLLMWCNNRRSSWSKSQLSTLKSQ